MRILFSVGDEGAERDVWLDADPSSPVSALADALEGSGPAPPRAWWSDRRALRMDAPIGTEVLDGAVLTTRPAPEVRPEPAGAIVLRAVAGPHAGTRWVLGPGEWLIGRSDEAYVNLVRDLEVSRRHAVVRVAADGVTLSDAGSSHGTAIEGQAVTDAPLAEDALAQVGATVLAWGGQVGPAGSVVGNGEGGLTFNRPPRLPPAEERGAVRFPGGAPQPSGVNFPLLATVAPLVLGVVLAVVVHNPLYLIFTLLAPIIGVSNYLSSRRSGRKSHRQNTQAYKAAVAEAEQQLADHLAAETRDRRRAAPDPGRLAEVAEGPLTTLWARRRGDADFMTLRVGLSDRPADTTVEGRPEASADPILVKLVPATVELTREGVLGVAGPRRACEALVTGLLVQASVLHAPDDLVVTILTGPHQQAAWSWARWLPHARDREARAVCRIAASDAAINRLAGDVSALVDERLGRNRFDSVSDSEPAHLVIVDGAYQLGALPAVTRILRRGPDAGVMAICIDDAERMLPEECRAVAILDAEQPALVRLRRGRTPGMEGLADLVDVSVAGAVARHLAPVHLNRRTVAGASIPTGVRLLEQLGLDPPHPEAVARRWSGGGRSTGALVGASEAGVMVLDLAHDGPHGLVAGTTGSGKSELLQTLIASLAVANRPDQMNFVLVDYKGGSAFKECSRLFHTVGMVTDLDGHLTERALASIGAELRRREVVLAGRGAKDLEAYWRVAGPDDPGLGRLLIVIDEFASLVEELPDFVDGLVDLARRGRSLGIHLILATQRPSGVVSAAIKTNTNLRIAMRVTDAADSVDVIDSPLASRIPKSVPGRGYARVGHEDLTEFQAARVGGRRPLTGAAALTARWIGWPDLGEPLGRGEGPTFDGDTTDLAVLVDAINSAAGQMGVVSPSRPWLEPLPALIALDSSAFLPPGPPAENGSVPAPAVQLSPAPAVFGVEDLPDRQAQQPAAFDVVRDGHLLVIGDPGSGRSTLLRTLAVSLASRNPVTDIHIYGIDCGNGALLPLQAFPHVGAVVTRREPDRVDRLVAKLTAEIAERQQLLSRQGFATIADQRRLSPEAERLPYLVVLLDRWEGFNAEFEALDGGRLVNSVMNLMREGPGVGVRVVVTADRSGTTPRFSSLAERILMMRLNDRNVYSVLGLNPRHLPNQIGPGRAFYARGGTELQVGLLSTDPSGPAQVAEVERLARVADGRAAGVAERSRPDPIAVLPVHVPLGTVLDRVATGARPTTPGPHLVVGIGGDRLAPALVDLGRSGPGFVISGPPRSGRSSALVAIADSVLSTGGRVFCIYSRPSPLTGLAERTGVAGMVDGSTAAQDELTKAIMAAGPKGLTLIVDDAELLNDTPASDVIAGFLRAARDNRSGVVVAGTAGELNQFRGFIPEARKSKTGLLLCPPATSEGDVLGVRIPRTALFAGPPGRGLLVEGGELTVVQVPFSETAGQGLEPGRSG